MAIGARRNVVKITVIATENGNRFCLAWESEFADDRREEFTCKTLWAPHDARNERIDIIRGGIVIASGRICEVEMHKSFPAFSALMPIIQGIPQFLRAQQFEAGDVLEILPDDDSSYVPSDMFDLGYFARMMNIKLVARERLYVKRKLLRTA